MKIALHVKPADGIPGRASFVGEFEIPPFITGMPNVVVWGSRTFERGRNAKTNHFHKLDGHGRTIYYETFAYVIVTEPTDATQ